MKVINFERENREFEWLMNELDELHASEPIEIMVAIYKKKDGRIGFGATAANNAEMLGLVELGKTMLIDEMSEWEG